MLENDYPLHNNQPDGIVFEYQAIIVPTGIED